MKVSQQFLATYGRGEFAIMKPVHSICPGITKIDLGALPGLHLVFAYRQ
jgi:hypothetical protein